MGYWWASRKWSRFRVPHISKIYCDVGFECIWEERYHSNIKGEHSYFSVRFSNQIVRSPVDDIDILVTFDAETIVRHLPILSMKGGILIYHPDVAGKKIEDIHSLDKSSEKRISHILKSKSKEFSMAGIIEELKERKAFS